VTTFKPGDVVVPVLDENLVGALRQYPDEAAASVGPDAEMVVVDDLPHPKDTKWVRVTAGLNRALFPWTHANVMDVHRNDVRKKNE